MPTKDAHPQYRGLLKVGYTSRRCAASRGATISTLRAGAPYRIVFEGRPCVATAPRLPTTGTPRVASNGSGESRGEWFRCTVREVGRRYAPCGSSAKPIPTHGAFCHAPRAGGSRGRPANISVPAVPTTTVRRISSGIAKCVSAKPSRPTSWHAAWDGNGCWSDLQTRRAECLGRGFAHACRFRRGGSSCRAIRN